MNRFSNDNSSGAHILNQSNGASKLRTKASINPSLKTSGTGLYATKDSHSKKMMGGGGLGENSSAFEVLVGSNSSF